MSVYDLSPETSEIVQEFFQMPSPQELRDQLAPRLQSADDRLANLATIVADREREFNEAVEERNLLEVQATRIRTALTELENVQPAG